MKKEPKLASKDAKKKAVKSGNSIPSKPSPRSRAVRTFPAEPGDRKLVKTRLHLKKKKDQGTQASESAEAFPIVGVGASAGGLEAFTQLLHHLPTDTGMGFVFVQHLAPEHESALPQLLAKATSMPVHKVTNNLRVEPNHLYIIPPNTLLTIAHGFLKLEIRRAGRAPHHSIDFFFESLARDRRNAAIGVILSGTASDGTIGLEAIKAEAGITFAQDDSAKQSSMPCSAIAAGCVDLILSPEDIAKELARIAKHPYASGNAGERQRVLSSTPSDSPHAQDIEGQDRFKIILHLLQQHSGVDFSLYKPNTIERRIVRRMVLTKTDSPDAFASFLKGKPKELEALYSDLLINVTSFFRNPAAFDVLTQKVFPKLVQQPRDKPVRVWVVGCSNGQEAYSIAMAFVEFSEHLGQARKLQLFATDLNDTLLEKGRGGFYGKNLVQDLSPAQLRRFFVEADGGYRIAKFLREMVIFARQNLLSDPPFSQMDLISCRNVLIYVNQDLQRKILSNLHYALKPEGFLFLGESESIGPLADSFEPVDKKHKVFRKKTGTATHPHIAPRRPSEKKEIPASKSPVEALTLQPQLNTQREADRVTLNLFSPPGVLINGQFQILQFRGETSSFLKPPIGPANPLHVLKMARSGLLLPLRSAIKTAKEKNQIVHREAVLEDQEPGAQKVNIKVVPLKNLQDRYYLIFFSVNQGDGGRAPLPSQHTQATAPTTKKQEQRHVSELEGELAETRDYLQSVQQQYEAANEGLQASNEEVTSANEELQSINEELETSKEELESTNEELTTVNDEMASRNSELNRLNTDLNNLQVTLNMAIVLLGRGLTVRSFTPLAEKLFNLAAADLGRPIRRIRSNLDFPDLEEFVLEVIDTLSLREREIRDKDGRWYLLRARPYLTLEGKIDGAVLILIDIDALKRSEQAIEAARDYGEAILRTTRYPFVVLTGDLRINTANAAFYGIFGVSPNETEGRLLFELGNGQWNIPKLRQFLNDILSSNSFFDDFEVTRDFPGIGRRTMLLNARSLTMGERDTPKRILLAIDDITDTRQMKALRVSETRYRRLFEAAKDGVLIVDAETHRITDANPYMTELMGYAHEEFLDKDLCAIGLFKDQEACDAAFRQLHEKGVVRNDNLAGETKAGDHRDLEMVGNLYEEGGREVIQCNIRDITGRKRVEEELKELNSQIERQSRIFDTTLSSITDFAYTFNREGRFTFVNRPLLDLWGLRLEEAIGKNFIDLKYPDDLAAKLQSQIQSVFETKAIVRDETSYTSPSGVTGYYEYILSPLTGNDGTVELVAGSTRDITERKHSEEALRESEARFRKMADNIGSLAWTCDHLGNVTWYNQRWLDYTGLTFEEMRDWGWKLVHHPDHVNRVVESVTRSRESGEVWEDTFPLRGKDGSYRWFLSRAFPIRDARGNIERWFGTNTDITELRNSQEALQKAQEELRNRAASLEKLVTERTASLRDTIGELESFSYSVAHDLRAPLRSMQSFSLILAQECGDQVSARAKDCIRRITAAGARMDKLIEDVLHYSRIGRAPLPMLPLDTERIITGILESYDHLQPFRADIRLEGNFPQVMANEALLTQCISNLLGNAVKFVANDVKPAVRVWAETHDSRVRLFFEDNGIGIEKPMHKKIFEIFEQLETGYEGTGIGLAIVKKAMERMGGNVGLESEVGRGSTFWLELARATKDIQ